LISLSKLTNSQRRYIYFQTKKKNLFKRYGQITTSQHVVRSFAHGTHTCIYIYIQREKEWGDENKLSGKEKKKKKKKTCCCWIYWALIATPELPSEWTPTSVTRVIVSKTRKRARQTPDSRNQRHKKKRRRRKKDLVAQADVSVLLTHMCVCKEQHTRRWTHTHTHTRPSPVFLAGLVSLYTSCVDFFFHVFFFFAFVLFFLLLICFH
jgi:hypothetical protein